MSVSACSSRPRCRRYAAVLPPRGGANPAHPTEIAAYAGLHAAAPSGSVVEIDRLVKAGAELNARDGYGRTPMMVAAFRQEMPPSGR